MMNDFFISSIKLNDAYINEIRKSYLKDVQSVRFLLEGNTLEFDNNVTFIVGENGSSVISDEAADPACRNKISD